jgi:hypothetical protein
VELLEYVIYFEKHSAIKSQVLAYFVVEWAKPNSAIECGVPETPWVVYYDGAWDNVGRSSNCTVFTLGN